MLDRFQLTAKMNFGLTLTVLFPLATMTVNRTGFVNHVRLQITIGNRGNIMIYSIFRKCSRYSEKQAFFSKNAEKTLAAKSKNNCTNNHMLFHTAIFILMTSLFPFLCTGCSTTKAPAPVSQSAFYLNTVVTITLYDGSDPALITECFDLCRHYEQEFSRTLETSTLYRLNHDTATERPLSEDLQALIATGLTYYEHSNGLFDITVAPLSDLWQFSSVTPTVPDDTALREAICHVGASKLNLNGDVLHYEDPSIQLDLGGIAKGYIADRLKENLVKHGVTSALIDLGGNILCVGAKPDGSPFRVGIREPFAPQGTSIAVAAVSDLSVVTSGVYERCFTEGDILYHHLLDPKTGYPFNTGLNSVSIISKASVDGDALSTVCFALGTEKGMELINSMPDVYAVFVTENNELVYSEGAEQFFQS